MKNKFYITTSIAYTNAPPHLGYALELVQADVIARYRRILKNDVFFLTGTDEHGFKIQKKAESVKKDPKEFVNELSRKFKKLLEILDISNDDFIRTTDKKKHWVAVEKAWLELKKNGDIYKKKYKGLYCQGCEAFVSKDDLVEGKCVNHNREPQILEEENYFFKLSKYAKRVKKIIDEDKIKIIPEKRKNEIIAFINKGIEDISFSRPRDKIKWGIPVPDDKNQVIYVWADALLNYISAIGYSRDNKKFRKYWPADLHCIGKDIHRFHCLIWPAMLLALKLSLPKKVLIHGFINVNNRKMSKSLGNVVDPFDLVSRYGKDAVRYFLLREIPPTEDGDFTYDKFEKRYISDLASGLGNLFLRVIVLAKKFNINFNVKNISNHNLKKEIDKTKKEYKKLFEEFKFNKVLELVWGLIGFCDKYIEIKKPWEKGLRHKEVLSDLILTIKEISKMIEPFLPETSKKIIHQLKNKEIRPLFPKINL